MAAASIARSPDASPAKPKRPWGRRGDSILNTAIPQRLQTLAATEFIRAVDCDGTGAKIGRMLIKLALGKGVQDSVRLAAIREWMDRASGRPMQSIAVSARIDDAGSRRLAEVLERFSSAKRAEMAALAAPADAVVSEPVAEAAAQ